MQQEKQHDNRYWQQIADDIRRYRKDEISREYLTETYPELRIEQRNGRWTAIKDAANIVIPSDCSLPFVAKIAFATKGEPFDVNQVQFDIEFAYQPVWETLPQRGRLKSICEAKKAVIFDSYIDDGHRYCKPHVDIRRILEYGDRGDEDGYGIEDDTWLVAKLLQDGTWLREWYVED